MPTQSMAISNEHEYADLMGVLIRVADRTEQDRSVPDGPDRLLSGPVRTPDRFGPDKNWYVRMIGSLVMVNSSVRIRSKFVITIRLYRANNEYSFCFSYGITNFKHYSFL
jgi:hypothetical protein